MPAATGPFELNSTYLRLRNDQSIGLLPVDAQFWQRLAAGELGSLSHEFMVTTHDYAADWSHWEMHPSGDEAVCLLSGAADFILQLDAEERRVSLRTPGSFVLVPRGAWHTAKISERSRLLFMTAGEGTQHRPLAP